MAEFQKVDDRCYSCFRDSYFYFYNNEKPYKGLVFCQICASKFRKNELKLWNSVTIEKCNECVFVSGTWIDISKKPTCLKPAIFIEEETFFSVISKENQVKYKEIIAKPLKAGKMNGRDKKKIREMIKGVDHDTTNIWLHLGKTPHFPYDSKNQIMGVKPENQ